MVDQFDFLSIAGRDSAFVPLEAGEYLFEIGDPSRVMFVVRWGQLEISYAGVVLETVGPGGIVGEMAMVDGAPRSASVRALTDCQVIPIDEPHFVAMVDEVPAFAVQVMRVMGRRLRAMNERLPTRP